MRPISRRLKSTCSITTVVVDDEPNFEGGQDTTETVTPGVPCMVQQRHTREGGVSEDASKQEVSRERVIVFLNPDVAITRTDKITWRGRAYEVDGEPAILEKRGVPHHLEVYASRTI